MKRVLCAVVCLVFASAASLILAAGETAPLSRKPQKSQTFPLQTENAGDTQAAKLHAIKTFSLPLTFEPNAGQARSDVQFTGRRRGMTVFLTREGIAVATTGHGGAVEANIVKIRLAGANKYSWRGRGKFRAESNYFLGNDPRKWRTHVPHFARAEALDALPGVGMAVYGNEEGVEYDLRAAPGVEMGALRLEISGANSLRLNQEGDLLIQAGGNEFRMRQPHVYQDLKGGARQSVEGGYVIEPDRTVGFHVGRHDARAALVLDPSLTMVYSTFLGGAGDDAANSMAIDSSGNVYIGGTTTSAETFPEIGSKSAGPGGGNSDYFVAKIDPAASGSNSLIYLTFLGGSASESGGGIAVDANGDVAITGTTTSSDFPVTDGSVLTTGTNDVTVSEIDPTGGHLIYSTLFGGNGAEATQHAGAIALDTSGNVFIAGDTTSTNLPVTGGAYQPNYGGGTSDGFLAVFEMGQAPTLEYCTYLGLNAQAGVPGLAVDSVGNAYIAGYTTNPGTSFTATNGFQSAYGGGNFNGFLMKILPSGNGTADLSYGTFLGGAGSDQALAVAVDAAGNAYVTGITQSKNFPVNGTNTAFQGGLKGTSNVFLAVITQDTTTDATAGQTSLVYSSYLGGSQTDTGLSVAVAAPNQVYVAGNATSADFPWLGNFQPNNGDQDAFIAKLDSTASGASSLIYATPLGGVATALGTGITNGYAVAADGKGHVYTAGGTKSADFPSAGNPGNGVQLTCSSCQSFPPVEDAFVAEIQESAAAEPSVSFNLTKVSFQGVLVGNSNPGVLPVAVHNTGNVPLTISSMGLAGTNAPDFSLLFTTGCTSSSIVVGGQCSFEVQFSPSTAVTETAVLSLTTNAPGNPQSLELVGIGNGPLAVLSQSSVTFASQSAGVTSPATSIMLTNAGNQPLSISLLQISGANVAEFQLQTNACSTSATVPAGGSCIFNVFFSSQTAGTFHAEVNVVDNSGDVSGTQQTVQLAGTATVTVPLAAVSPASLTFASQAAGTTSGTQTVTLQNTGSASLNLTSVTTTGSNALNFNIIATGSNPCQTSSGETIPPGGTCTVTVNFAPPSGDTAGAKSATLNFSDNASGSPQTVALTGMTTVPPVVQLSPSSAMNFGTQLSGTNSAATTVTLSNTGSSVVTITGVSITGANPGAFHQTNNCPPSLATSGTCAIQASFQPTAAGNFTASLSISDNAQGSPQTIPLSGTATDFSITDPPNSGTSQTITAGQMATYNLQIISTTGIPGGVTPSCTGTISEAACTAPPGTLTVNANQTVSFSVSVTTTARSAAPVGKPPKIIGPRMMLIAVMFALLVALGICVKPVRQGQYGARARRFAQGCLLLAGFALAMSGCGGGGGGGGSSGGVTDPGTPAGTYSLTVIGAGNGGTRSISLTLIVQ